jgi:hypothetical protein
VTIRQDSQWRREVVPPNLAELASRLCAFYKVPATHAGTKGNEAHRQGYHRSRRFLLMSQYAGSRSYSVSEPGNRGGDEDWISALDFSLDDARLIAACKRLDDAVRAGKLEKVAEWYGNRDGDNRVDGFDNIRNRVASSDPSHLWHLHISLIRSHADDDHTDIFEVLTGGESDMEPTTPVPTPPDVGGGTYLGKGVVKAAGWIWHATYFNIGNLGKTLKALADTVAANEAAAKARDAATLAAINKLSEALRAGTGASSDTAMILTRIDEAESSVKPALDDAGKEILGHVSEALRPPK